MTQFFLGIFCLVGGTERNRNLQGLLGYYEEIYSQVLNPCVKYLTSVALQKHLLTDWNISEISFRLNSYSFEFPWVVFPDCNSCKLDRNLCEIWRILLALLCEDAWISLGSAVHFWFIMQVSVSFLYFIQWFPW